MQWGVGGLPVRSGAREKIKARLGNLASRVEKTKTEQSVYGTAFRRF